MEMDKKVTLQEKLFIGGLLIILVFNLIHDWVPLGSLNDLEGIRSQHTIDELVTITITNTVSILIVLTLALWFAGKRYPLWARIWIVVHLACVLIGVLNAWWIPYFTGADAEFVAKYQAMFGNTHAFLPEMNGIVPNTLHVLFHATLVFVLILSIYISFRQPSRVFQLDWSSTNPTT